MNRVNTNPQEQLKHILHPWEAMGDFPNDWRGFLSHAEGIYVYDSEGKKLIDGPAGMWCTQVGYGRRELADTMAEQAMKMAYYSPWNFDHPLTTELAAQLAARSPGDLNTVSFTTGGSTAVDTALRFVMFYNNVKGRPDKKHILCRDAGYHGSTYLAASVTGKDRDRNYFDFITDTVHRLSAPNPYKRPEGMSVEDFTASLLKEFEDKVLELGADKVAAFIAEPIQASGGVIVPPPGYLTGCRDLCTKHDIIYISDEVVTAFGRLGHWFASEDVFGIVPDIITCAKGLTSGYVPMGAALFSDSLIAEVSGEENEGINFVNGFTYSGHPVASAVALKNIEIMEREGILEHAREISPYFQQKLKELEDIPIVGEVRGMGLVGCVECVITGTAASEKEKADAVATSGTVESAADRKKALKLDKAIGSRIDEHCLELGLVVRPLYNMCVMSPPLIITKAQVDDMVSILREGILRAQADVEREGLWSPDVA
ncbi:MAG: aminotransferase [Kiloniellales bacterium]